MGTQQASSSPSRTGRRMHREGAVQPASVGQRGASGVGQHCHHKGFPIFFPLHLPIFSPPLQCTASLFLFPHVHLTVPPIIFPCTCFTVRRCQGTMKAHFSLVLCLWHLPCVVFWGNPLSASGVLYANLYLWCATFNIHAHDVLYLYFRPAVFVFVMCRICRVLTLCWNNFLLLLRPASASGQACRATSC